MMWIKMELLELLVFFFIHFVCLFQLFCCFLCYLVDIKLFATFMVLMIEILQTNRHRGRSHVRVALKSQLLSIWTTSSALTLWATLVAGVRGKMVEIKSRETLKNK